MMSPLHLRSRLCVHQLFGFAVLLVALLCAAPLAAQITVTGVAIPGVGSFVDATKFPRVTVRFRATRNNQPLTTLTDQDVYVQESNRFMRISSLTPDGSGTWRAEFTASTFSPTANVYPTIIDGGAFLYVVNAGDVGVQPMTWRVNPDRGGSVFICDSSFKRVPLFLDLGDVAVGEESLTKLNLRTFTATRDPNGNERRLFIDSLLTSSSDFTIVWKRTYGSKAPPVEVDVGTDYRFDLIFKPTKPGPVSGLLTVVIEGGQRFTVMLFANTPTYNPSTLLKLVSPNGGERLAPCQQIPIRWKGAIRDFSSFVEYSTNNGRTWNFIDSTMDSSLVWDVPQTYTDSLRLRVYQKQGASDARWLYGEQSKATNLAFSADGRYVSTVYQNGTVVEWDVSTSTVKQRYTIDGTAVPGVKVSALSYAGSTRNLIAVVNRPIPARDQIVRLDSGKATPTAVVEADIPDVSEVCANESGTIVYVAGPLTASIRVLNGADLSPRSTIALDAPISAVRYVDSLINVALITGDVVRLSPETGTEVARYQTGLLRMGAPLMQTLSVSRSNGLIALAGVADAGKGNAPQEQRTFLFDTRTSALIRVIYREGSNIVGVTINPSETFVTLGALGQPQIQQYDVVRRKILGGIPGMPGHSLLMNDIEYGPDGSTLASCSDDLRENMLVRRIINPETDVSDGVGAIMPPDMTTPTISFGNQLIGSRIDTLISGEICNRGSVAAIFTSGQLLGSSWVTLTDPFRTDTIAPGECLPVRFRAVPKDTGLLTDTFELKSCDRTIRIPIQIRSIDRNFTTFGDLTAFGDVCVGDTARRTFQVIRNNDPVPVIIDGIYVRKGSDSQFRVRGYKPGAPLAPGESLQIEVLFVPRLRGHDTDEVVVTYAGQNVLTRSIRVTGRGAGDEISVSHRTLAFIPENRNRTIVLRNNSSTPTTLTEANISPGAPFTSNIIVPVEIPAGDSVVYVITYTGEQISGNDILSFRFTPCAAITQVRLVEYAGTAVVRPQSVTVDPREIVRIPIITSITENVSYNGVRPIEATIIMDEHHFFAQSIEVAGGFGEILSQEVFGGRRMIRFRAERSFNRQDTAIWLVGPAGIGTQDSSIMSFDTASIGFSTVVPTGWQSALLRIANPDPTRHFRYPTGPIIVGISPVPASDAVTVRVRSDRPAAARLRIIDPQGSIVRTTSFAVASELATHALYVSDLMPGAYQIVLDADGTVSTTSMVIVR
ncbi:MAG: choice-of-anchor D domain-containing protein [Candidatus Kapabacteria bacterium]|nr:choice-of-anchor D domain-containing protein [Candidatus Kapabacteria bacterium]